MSPVPREVLIEETVVTKIGKTLEYLAYMFRQFARFLPGIMAAYDRGRRKEAMKKHGGKPKSKMPRALGMQRSRQLNLTYH